MEIRENLCEFYQIFPFLLALMGKKFYTLISVSALGDHAGCAVVTQWHISERVIGDQYEENREEHNRSG